MGLKVITELTIIGGGLAGSEAAWQAAERGINVTLYEMRPLRGTGAHVTGNLAELVCSNSLGSNLPDRPSGLLKEELRRMGSLLLRCAAETSVPAGGALAVGREAFAGSVTAVLEKHERITILREECTAIPDGPCIIASGPLTSPALAESIGALSGEEHLFFYDAISPIVSAESIDLEVAYRASRYDRGEDPGGDYINCPMNREEYERFVDALLSAERIPLRDFERELRDGVRAVGAISLKGVYLSRSSPSAGGMRWLTDPCGRWGFGIREPGGDHTRCCSCGRTILPGRCITSLDFKPTSNFRRRSGCFN